MARNPFGGSISDFVVTTRTVNNVTVWSPASATILFYDAETGGNQITDLALDAAGTQPVTSIPATSDGEYPTFYGPDGVTELWGSANGGPRVKLVSLSAAAAAVASAQSSATAAANSATAAQNAAASVPATTDAAVAPLVPSSSGSATAAALAAAYVGKGALVLNLKDYGAKGDGTTDDSAAVGAWVDAVLAAQAVGYAPPGNYLLSSAVTRTVDSKHFALVGAGVGLTRFIVPASNTSGAFLFSSATARDAQLTAQDFTIVPQGVGNGTGLAFTMPAGGNQHKRSAILTNVEVKADDITAPVFSIGINLAGTWRPTLRNVVVGGPWDPTVASNYADTSPQYVGTAALVLDDAYDWTVDNCHLWAYYTLLRDTGTTSEAGRLVNSVLANGRIGFDRHRSAPEPIVWVDNCHFNNRDINMRIDGAKLAVIRGCHPYNQDTGNVYTGTATDIQLLNTDRTIISNCVFHYDGAPDRININLDTTTLGNNLLVEGCVFSALAATAIHVGSGATIALILGNIYPGTITNRVQDDSGTALILDRDSGGGLRMEYQNAGSASGPDLLMRRDSASPAANDSLASVQMWGRNSAAAWTEYALLRAALNSPTAGAESGGLDVWTMVAGALTKIANFGPTSNVGNTGMFLLCQTSTGTTLRRVSLGAADSAGTGYTYLRVPN